MSHKIGQHQRLKFTPHSISFWHFISLLLLSIDYFGNHPCFALRDDWFGYSSFEDVSEWSETYYQLCSRSNFDLYREPRVQTKADDLRPINEALSPVKIEDDENVTPAPENVTLHIYSNAGIRKGYSFSYGFQRNKECLHGQDADCIVAPEFGRTRALVLSAERFKENENLNFIKDHFEIEEPERFVTILNGGSNYERKFYEAIFLGGRKNTDPRRSSHQINGVAYPLEIYMYFVDETVPSVTLSTVLVVLVEESERDNHYVKPLVTSVEKLYDEERRFLESNKLMVRRERMYHHLGKSTQFDIYDAEGVYEEKKQIIQQSLDATAVHQPSFAAHLEAFEKMQALEAILFFIDEDVEHVNLANELNSREVHNFQGRIGNFYFPYNGAAKDNDYNSPITPNHELHVMAVTAGAWPLRSEKLPKTVTDCSTVVDWMMDGGYAGYFNLTTTNASLRPVDWRGNTFVPRAGSRHFNAMKYITRGVCNYLEGFMQLAQINQNNQLMRELSYLGKKKNGTKRPEPGKYQLMKFMADTHKTSLQANAAVTGYLNYFHQQDLKEWDWRYPSQQELFVTSLLEFILQLIKSIGYRKVKKELAEKIAAEVNHLHFPNEKTMRDVVHYLKYGDKGNTAAYKRSILHEQFITNFLPSQQKRRGLIELGNMEMAEDKIDDEETVSPKKGLVDQAFQISWLMPHDGGYYYYEGSSPVPPCFRVENMIVFKKPIKMSKHQIDTLTRVPVNFDRERDITSTTPIIHDTYFLSDLRSAFSEGQKFQEVNVTIYDQKKNHLFLGHDGVHKNAVEEYERIKARRSQGNSLIKIRGFVGAEILMSLVFVIGVRAVTVLGYV